MRSECQIMTRCARAAAAADAAFVRNVFRGEASVEYHASAKGLTPHAGAELAVATAQPRAFAQWRGAATFVPDEHTATHDTTEAAAKAHGLHLLAKMPIDPKLAELADAGKIEDFQGNWLAGVWNAIAE